MLQDHDNSELYGQAQADDDTINLLDYLDIIVKHNRFIIRSTVAAFVISIGISLLLPKIYTSTAMIIPSQQDPGLMGMMMGQMGGGMASIAGDLLGKGSTADMYVSMLNSNAVSDKIIDRFKLMQVYGQKYRLNTYKVLDNNVDISAGKKDGIISITIEDKDPKRAAEIANAYVEELSKLTVKLNITGAGQNKVFLEDRLARAKVDLARAEDALKTFQTRNKVVSVPDQATATIGSIAQLKGQLALQEVQLVTLLQQFTERNQEVKTVKASISNLRSQIAQLEGKGSGGSIPGVGSVPALGEQYVRLMREFKIQETLVEILTKQYEMAELNATKDIPSLQVLQIAQIPDKKTKPKRSLIVLAITSVVGFIAVLYAFLLEAVDRMPDKDRERLRKIKCQLLGISGA